MPTNQDADRAINELEWPDIHSLGNTPDIIGYMRDGSGRLVAIEVKLPGEKPNPDQIAWQEHGKANRVVCGIARSVDEAFAIVKGS